jgi:hypothetical protein
MPWDSDKSTAADPDNPAADEQLTADEWDAHVSEGHFPADELNFGVDGNGDPVMTDPQNADEVIARYDRSEGAWVFDSVVTEEVDNNSSKEIFAGNKSGADPDARLDQALSDASDGDVVRLEKATYTDARTGPNSINTRLHIIANIHTETVIDADWEITETGSTLSGGQIDGDDTVSFDAGDQSAEDVTVTGTMTISGDRFTAWGLDSAGNVTFESGSSDGEVGPICGAITTSDNGSNNFLT